MWEGGSGELNTEPTELKSSLIKSGGPMYGGTVAAMSNSTLRCKPLQNSLQNGTSIAREIFQDPMKLLSICLIYLL